MVIEANVLSVNRAVAYSAHLLNFLKKYMFSIFALSISVSALTLNRSVDIFVELSFEFSICFRGFLPTLVERDY